MTDRPYFFDARSAAWPRTTGWERYAREVALRLARTDQEVAVRTAGSLSIASRLWQDAAATPWAARRSRVAHFPTLPPVPWARPTGTLVYTLHDLTWWRWPETSSLLGRHYYAPLAHAAVRRGVHLVTDTRAVADEIQDHFRLGDDRVTVVPLGVALPAPSGRRLRDRPYLLAVGTVEPRKNLPLLAEAYVRSGLGASHDLVAVGRQGWGTLPAEVHVVSGLDDASVADMYAGASALVLPSLYEGFGLPAVEAMQLGTRVVCSDLPVLREVTGGYASYVNPRDVDGWVEALRSVAEDPSVPSAAGQWARATYSWDVTTSELSALYRRLDRQGGNGA
jgi:glycosyltransferase involved in cell wall biosynthesis